MKQGRPIEVKHPLADTLREKAEEGGEDPAPLLSLTTLFGELGRDAAPGPAAAALARLAPSRRRQGDARAGGGGARILSQRSARSAG